MVGKEREKLSKIILTKWVPILIGGIIFIMAFWIITKIISPKQENSYQNILTNQSKDIVYDIENNSIQKNDKVPRINLNTEKINQINKEIETSYEDYLAKFTDGYTYQYNISNNILSILITSKQRYNDALNYDITYKSYNIDLGNLEPLNQKQLLKKFNITEKQLRYFITYKFVNYYNDLIKKQYFTEEECNYNCFIESKNIFDYLENNQYYINNNHLEVYKYFNIFTDYKEEEYFTEDSFHFIIK